MKDINKKSIIGIIIFLYIAVLVLYFAVLYFLMKTEGANILFRFIVPQPIGYNIWLR